MPTVALELGAPAELVFPPGEFASVGRVFPEPFPDGLASFEAFPAPLGSLPELLSPAALAGPFGMPFTAAVPAPADPALGDPTELPVPTVGPLVAPGAPPELAAPAVPPADAPPPLPPPAPPPPPLPWANTAAEEQVREKTTNTANFEIAILLSPNRYGETNGRWQESSFCDSKNRPGNFLRCQSEHKARLAKSVG
jgi:hypothetical protein